MAHPGPLRHHQQHLRLRVHDLRYFLERLATSDARHPQHNELLGRRDRRRHDPEWRLVLGAGQEIVPGAVGGSGYCGKA